MTTVRAIRRTPAEFDRAIVDLELEALRRGIPIDGPVERTPPALALERCRYWLGRGDVDAAARCMGTSRRWARGGSTRTSSPTT